MKIAPISVEYVDKMGSDLSVVNAARVSFDKVAEVFSDGDARLINYLARHNHWSPFAHTSLQLRIKAPIFVARQLVKHQIGLVWNEVSRRYVDTEPEFYFPTYWRMKADNKKQGSLEDRCEEAYSNDSGDPLFGAESDDEYANWVCRMALDAYTRLLKSGVCAEQARMILPQNMMTEWIWTGNVMSFARVCQLRLDSHTQKETRDVAVLIDEMAEGHFPVAWKALMNKESV